MVRTFLSARIIRPRSGLKLSKSRKESLRDGFLYSIHTTSKVNTAMHCRMEMRTHYRKDRDADAYALNVINVLQSAQSVSIPLTCKMNQDKTFKFTLSNLLKLRKLQ